MIQFTWMLKKVSVVSTTSAWNECNEKFHGVLHRICYGSITPAAENTHQADPWTDLVFHSFFHCCFTANVFFLCKLSQMPQCDFSHYSSLLKCGAACLAATVAGLQTSCREHPHFKGQKETERLERCACAD